MVDSQSQECGRDAFVDVYQRRARANMMENAPAKAGDDLLPQRNGYQRANCINIRVCAKGDCGNSSH